MTGPTTAADELSEGVSHRIRRISARLVPGSDGDRLRDSPPVRSVLGLFAVVAALALGGCDDDAGDTQQFCDDVAANLEALRSDPTSDDAVDDLIDLWRDIGGEAPLAIAEEWDEHADNLELARTSDDPQEVVASAFAAERSAVAIAEWLAANCDIDWGPVTTIVPGTIPAASLPGASTTTTSTTPGG